MDDIPVEAPTEDVMEQRAEVRATDDDGSRLPPLPPEKVRVPWDADPADVLEQQAEVPLDDDWP